MAALVSFRRAAFFSLVLAGGLSAEARTWTDSSGKRIEAEFVRVFGDKVVLDWNGKPLQVPISSLSADDQEYLRGRAEKNQRSASEAAIGNALESDVLNDKSAESDGVQPWTGGAAKVDPFAANPSKVAVAGAFRREWTDTKGRKLIGKFVEVDGDKIVVDRDGKMVRVRFATLSAVDQTYVHKLLKDRDIADPFPGAAASDDQLAATRKPERDIFDGNSKSKVNRDLDSESRSNGKIQPLASRVWKDISGKKITARFSTMKGSSVVLIFRKKPMEVPYQRLSDEDQTYIRDRLTERNQTALLAGVEPRFAPAPVAAPPPVFNAAPAAPRFANDPFADSRRRMDEHLAESRRQHEQFARDAEARRQRQDQEMRDRMAHLHARPAFPQGGPAIMPSSVAPPQNVSPPVAAAPTGALGTEKVWVHSCSKCRHQISADYKGTSCPHCHVEWEYEELEDGTKRYIWSPVNIMRGVGGIVVALVVAYLRFRRS